jgi:hypothetical protein
LQLLLLLLLLLLPVFGVIEIFLSRIFLEFSRYDQIFLKLELRAFHLLMPAYNTGAAHEPLALPA